MDRGSRELQRFNADKAIRDLYADMHSAREDRKQFAAAGDEHAAAEAQASADGLWQEIQHAIRSYESRFNEEWTGA